MLATMILGYVLGSRVASAGRGDDVLVAAVAATATAAGATAADADDGDSLSGGREEAVSMEVRTRVCIPGGRVFLNT